MNAFDENRTLPMIRPWPDQLRRTLRPEQVLRKRVKYRTPNLPHVSTAARTDCTPRACPAVRGNNRLAAQRPLPSIMMATWFGTVDMTGISIVELMAIGMTDQTVMISASFCTIILSISTTQRSVNF